jgi:hypothetical protein
MPAATKRFRPVVANPHVVAEGMAKAALLRHPDDRLLRSKKHNFIVVTYNRYSHQGNTDSRFAPLLNDLAEARNPARYPSGEFPVTETQAAEWLTVAKEMYDWLLSVSPIRTRLRLLA